MKLLTHMIISILILSILALYGILIPSSVFSLVLGLIVLCIGSILPDLDLELDKHFVKQEVKENENNQEELVTKSFRFHRRLLHNYVIVFILLLACYLFYQMNLIIFPYFLLFSIGYISHIVFDTFTKYGVSLYGTEKRIKGLVRVSCETDLLILFILSIIVYFLIIIRVYLIL